MNIDLWFPVSILSTKLDGKQHDLKKLVKRAYAIKATYPAGNDWRCDTYTSYGKYDLLKDGDFKSLLSGVNPILKEFATYYGVKLNKITCHNAWINIAEPGMYQEYHIHPNNHFSAVVYLQTAPECGNIVFKNQSGFLDMFELNITENRPSNFQTCSYTPEDLKVLMFRSNLMHMVEKNKSDKDRISVAFNFTV